MRLRHLIPLLFAPLAWGGELIDRVRLPVDERGTKVATLAPLRLAHLPVLPQIIVGAAPGGITTATTTTSGCTDFSVLTSRSSLVDCTTSVTIADGATGAAVFAGQVQTTAGLVTVPSVAFEGCTTCGLFFSDDGGTLNGPAIARLSAVKMGWFAHASLPSAIQLVWNSATDFLSGAPDLGLEREGVGVLEVTNGSTGSGWLQQPAGELALNADYTNATAVFSDTALVATLKSGRTYSFTLALLFANSTAADGFLVDFESSTATVTNFRAHCSAANAVGAALAFTTANTTALATNLDVTLALTTQALMTCQGTFVPSADGTFIVRGSEKVDGGGTLTIFRGSWLNIRDASPL